MDRFFSHLTQSVVRFIKSNHSIHNMLKPIAKSYRYLAGYQQLGLKYDDLLRMEDASVKDALKRLPKQEMQMRMYRQKRAMQASIMQQDVLPKDQHTASDDFQLTQLVRKVEKEQEEKAYYDSK